MRDNLALKLVAVLIALVLEIYLHSPNNSRAVELVAPVEFRNLPSSRMVLWPAGLTDGQVKITVKGPSHLVESLKLSTPVVFVDLPLPIPVRYHLEFSASQLNLPRGVEVVQFEPSRSEVVFDSVVKRELTVIPQVIGGVKEGYEIARVRVFPPTVSARGPRAELSGIASLGTQAIDVSNLSENKSFEVEIIEVQGRTLLGLNFVTVEVDVEPKRTERSFNNIPISVIANLGQGVLLMPSKVSIVLSGPEAAIGVLKQEQLIAEIDCRDLDSGSFKRPVRIVAPEGMKVNEVFPEVVSVTVGVNNERETNRTKE